MPNEETFCSGQVTVPNIYNVPIILARMMLKEYGWQPEQSRQEPDATSQGLLDMGINEVDGCAGTGCGFCRFAYKYAGNSLSVTTVGDSPDTPSVISYDVKCSN